jgi:hypothetical protein
LVRTVKPKVAKRLWIKLGYILHKKIKSHFSLKQCYIIVPVVTILPISQLLIYNLQVFIIWSIVSMPKSMFLFNHTNIILVKCTIHLSIWKVDVNQPQTVTIRSHSNPHIHTPGCKSEQETCSRSHILRPFVKYNSLITVPSNECYWTDL